MPWWVVWLIIMAISVGVWFLYRVVPRPFIIYGVVVGVVVWLLVGDGIGTLRNAVVTIRVTSGWEKGKPPVPLHFQPLIVIDMQEHDAWYRLDEILCCKCAEYAFSGRAACNWQRELARVSATKPVPTDPETQRAYVYVSDGVEALVGAEIEAKPVYSCFKSGGRETLWLVYMTVNEGAHTVCADQLSPLHLRQARESTARRAGD